MLVDGKLQTSAKFAGTADELWSSITGLTTIGRTTNFSTRSIITAQNTKKRSSVYYMNYSRTGNNFKGE